MKGGHLYFLENVTLANLWSYNASGQDDSKGRLASAHLPFVIYLASILISPQVLKFEVNFAKNARPQVFIYLDSFI